MATSILQEYLQEAVVTICSEKLGCPLWVSLFIFEEYLFLMTSFKFWYRCREHGKESSKFGGVEEALVNVLDSIGEGLPKKRKISS